MLRLMGKIIAGAAVTAATTYLGNKFLEWAGVIKRPTKPKRKKPDDNVSNV